jgi:hypothetical protein
MTSKNWSDIKRGWMYEAAIPFTGERPLDFFIPDEANELQGRIEAFN